MIAITAGLRLSACRVVQSTEPRLIDQRRPFISATRAAATSYSRPTCRSRLSIRYARALSGQRPAGPLGSCISPHNRQATHRDQMHLTPAARSVPPPFSGHLFPVRATVLAISLLYIRRQSARRTVFLLHFTANLSSYKSIDPSVVHSLLPTNTIINNTNPPNPFHPPFQLYNFFKFNTLINQNALHHRRRCCFRQPCCRRPRLRIR